MSNFLKPYTPIYVTNPHFLLLCKHANYLFSIMIPFKKVDLQQLLKFLIIFLTCFWSKLAIAGIDWSYSAANSSKNWGEISEDYKFCKIGLNQSPINISSQRFSAHDLRFDYRQSLVEKISEKFNLRVNFIEQSEIFRGKKRYLLRHLDFHHPSEHQIDGEPHSLEMQISHKSDDEQLLILAFFLEVGKYNQKFDPLIEFLQKAPDATKNEEKRVAEINHLIFGTKLSGSKDSADDDFNKNSQHFELNLAKIFNFKDLAFFYEGSITTPPCFEGVKWYVFQQPIQISKEQMNQIIKLAIFAKTNAREVQIQKSEIF